MNNNRVTIRVAGESGQGINSIGEALCQAFKKVHMYTFGYREYPSLIRGGHAFYQVDASIEPVQAATKNCDVLVCMSRVAFHTYYQSTKTGGIIIHDIARLDLHPEEESWLNENNVQVVYVNAPQLAEESGGKRLMSNTVILGIVWKALGLPVDKATEVIKEIFAKKPQYIEVNVACLTTGYQQELATNKDFKLQQGPAQEVASAYLLSGNHAIALGAIAAGVRAYFAYPMTPSSSILTYLAAIQHQTDMLVKQVDDEIAAAQMALGSMFMGTRAMTGTSGGGFDLMTETVSLAGMTETPFVCVIAQRPGPATGLPTWTSAGDLLLAVFAGHGEFPRVVLAASDAISGYRLTQVAFNLAEEFQIPVLLLTEKFIGESAFTVLSFPENQPINRGLVPDNQLDQLQPKNRYEHTSNGVSKRWLPGQADATYVGNSDEHLEDGSLTEDAVPSKAMMDKRMRKLDTILALLPEPELFGPTDADITFVGWGGVKPVMLDVLQILKSSKDTPSCNYLHYEYMHPLKTDFFMQTVSKAKRVVLIENNATAQLGQLLGQKTGFQFTEKLLKYDGRPFFIEDILDYVQPNQEQRP